MFASLARRSPATFGLIAAYVALYVLAWLQVLPKMLMGFAATSSSLASAPWTLVLYPFAGLGMGADIFFFLLTLVWIYFVGRQIEIDLGLVGLLAVFFGGSLLAGLLIVGAASILGSPFVLAGSLLPLSILTCLWASRRPTSQILIYGIFPLQAKWLAVLDAVLVLFNVGSGQPVLGVVALIPLALAWLWGAGKLGLAYGNRAAQVFSVAERKAAKARAQEDAAYFENVRKREQEREEKERLRKLFENSLRDSGEDPDGSGRKNG